MGSTGEYKREKEEKDPRVHCRKRAALLGVELINILGLCVLVFVV